jgi:hypothetical protein
VGPVVLGGDEASDGATQSGKTKLRFSVPGPRCPGRGGEKFDLALTSASVTLIPAEKVRGYLRREFEDGGGRLHSQYRVVIGQASLHCLPASKLEHGRVGMG